MTIYSILKNKFENCDELERFDEEKWERRKGLIDSSRILYSTCDIEDEKLKDFDKIIWGRYFDPKYKVYKKIFIPFTPDNIQKMQSLYDEITEELLKKTIELCEELERKKEEKHKKRIEERKNNPKFQTYIEQKEYNNTLIPEGTNEIDAIHKWKELEYVMPAPKVIENIKKSYNMSWSKFINHIIDNF